MSSIFSQTLAFAVSNKSSSEIRGLTAAEVVDRRARGLGNDAQISTTRSYIQIVRENVFTFVNNVLFGLGVALVLLGRVSDAAVSVLVVLFNVLVSVAQEIRAKRALDRIVLLTRPKATVIRDGQPQEIDPAEIVVGDVVRVGPGDQIVVDGPVLGAGRMEVDESLLTGEADRISKQPGDMLLSGSFCVTGGGLYEAQKVGTQSYAYRITAGARAFRRVYTPLQREINLVIRVLILVVAYFEILLSISSFFNGIPIVESVRMSVVIAGLVPNGLFLAIAVAYSLGALRIARQGALVQQANAIESLSNVDVLCLDKTGTLTANALKLVSIKPLAVSDEVLRTALSAYAASTVDANHTISALAEALPGQKAAVSAEVPFSSDRKWSALSFDDEPLRGVYVMGAPEFIKPGLRPGVELSSELAEWSARAWRVVLLAHRPEVVPLFDAEGHPQLPCELTPLGLVGFTDQLRPEAAATLESFRASGIDLKIISGDNPQTVTAVAAQAGLPPEARAVSGIDLAEMDPLLFDRAADEATVFGRITPQQKQQLVKSLKRRGHYVAMIGDGVNDVLSLKEANLGISMQSGSQATRNVADIILLNDSFASLPTAFMEGQRILNGMQDILKIFLTRVVYVALLFLSTGLLGGFPFEPKQSSLLALLTVGIPTVALAAWAQPGHPHKRELIRALLHFVIPAAFSISLIALLVYVITLVRFINGAADANPPVADILVFGRAQAMAQTALTTISVVCGLALLAFVQPPIKFFVGGDHISRDWRPTILAAILLVAYLFILNTPLRNLFDLSPLDLINHAVIAIAAFVWAWLLRFTWRARLLERFVSAEGS